MYCEAGGIGTLSLWHEWHELQKNLRANLKDAKGYFPCVLASLRELYFHYQKENVRNECENPGDIAKSCSYICSISTIVVTKEQALQKIKHYCSYQERCHKEVKEKLYGFGLWKKDVETVISQLIEENYLNEERFSELFAGGKFRMKQWGRVKIRHELKQKQISEYCIKKGLKEIDEDLYNKTLDKLAAAKWKTLKGEKNIFIKKSKTINFLLQRGFEHALANVAVTSLQEKKE